MSCAIVGIGLLVVASCASGTTSPAPPARSPSNPAVGTPPGAETTDAIVAPEAFALDVNGQVLFSDCVAQRVFRIVPEGQIQVVAGSGPAGFENGGLAGDGGPAIEARLNCPGGLAVDPQGNLFVADTLNNRVRMIDTSGIITTVAGSGATGLDQGGYAGDGGPATEATFEFPYGLAFDADGNLYVTDHGNDVIREIDAKGDISTIAGTGHGGLSGDGGPATRAELHGPWSIVFDRAGDLIFTDKENGRVRTIDTPGTISTVAGGGGAAGTFADPYGLAIDATGRLFVSDDVQNVIRMVDGDSVTTIAGDEVATPPPLRSPFGLLMDPENALYVADAGNSCVRLIDKTGEITDAVCG